MEWRDPNTGQIKTWVWGVAALGFVGFLFIITKVVGGGQTTAGGTLPVAGQSSDITDLLSQLTEALADMQDPTNPTTPPVVPPVTGFKNYTVLAGDTWRDIAGKFGMTLDEFFVKNPTLRTAGTPDTARKGGRTVLVKDIAAKTKTPVKFTLTNSIDTWKEVAAKYNLSLTQFFALNPSLDTAREKNATYERKAGRQVVVGSAYT